MKFNLLLTLLLVILFGACSSNADKKSSDKLSSTEQDFTENKKPAISGEKAQFKPIQVPSTWIMYFDDSQKYGDTLELFSDSTFRMTQIEIDDVHFGRLSIKEDSLTLQVMRGKWDEDFKAGSRHRTSLATHLLIQSSDDMLDQRFGNNLMVWEEYSGD